MKNVMLAGLMVLALAACREENKEAEAPAAIEQNAAMELPPALMFDGRPLDPMCIDINMEGVDYPHSVDLSACRSEDMVYTEILPRAVNPDTGFITVEYDYKDPQFSMRGPFVAYRYIGALDNGHAIEVNSSGGGTGVFSTIRILRREGDKLTVVDDIGGGDRCNGGIADAKVKDGRIHYAMMATSYDLAVLGMGDEPGVEPYDDLYACAACCMGTIRYEDAVPVGMALDQDIPENTEPDQERPAQMCFEDLYRAYAAAGKTELDMDDVRQFSAEFTAKCLPPGQ